MNKNPEPELTPQEEALLEGSGMEMNRLKKLHGHLLCEIDFGDALYLIGSLQLTFRHPHATRRQRDALKRLIERLSAAFKDCPNTLEIIRRGWK